VHALDTEKNPGRGENCPDVNWVEANYDYHVALDRGPLAASGRDIAKSCVERGACQVGIGACLSLRRTGIYRGFFSSRCSCTRLDRAWRRHQLDRAYGRGRLPSRARPSELHAIAIISSGGMGRSMMDISAAKHCNAEPLQPGRTL
jgi:hypothetical protein